MQPSDLRFDPMLPIPFALVQVASTSLLYAAPRPRNMVSSVPSRLGEHPGEATLLHGKAMKARSTTSKIHTSGLWIDKLANQELRPFPCTDIRSSLRHLPREPLPTPQLLPIVAASTA